MLVEIPDILHSSVRYIIHCFTCEEALVRGDDHVVERQQARQHVVVHDTVRGVLVEVPGLLLVNVQSGSSDLLLLQSVDQRLGVDQLAAARVDEDHARFHVRNGHVADHVARLVGQRAVERNDVRTTVQFVERHIGDARFRGVLRVGEKIVGHDLHAESLENADQLAGDLARADDARGLAVHVEAHQPVKREVAVARAPVGAVYLAVERQHQRHGVFRHGVRRIGRNPHHGNPVTGGGVQIDVVEARAAQRDQLHTHPGQLADGLGVSRVVDEDADRIGTLRKGYIIGVQVAAVVADVEPVGVADAVERLPVVGLRAE